MPDFVKMPDGSLIMVGKPAPKQSAWERFKATVRAIPDRFSPKPAPWWIEQPRQAAPVVQAREAVPVMQQTAQQLTAAPTVAVNDFEEAEKEAAKRAAIVQQFGDVPRRILASEFFVGKERK